MMVSVPRLVAFTGSALGAAIALAHFTRHELGLPRQVVRTDSLLSALVVAATLIVLIFLHRLGRKR
jgi:hypothetical protein